MKKLLFLLLTLSFIIPSAFVFAQSAESGGITVKRLSILKNEDGISYTTATFVLEYSVSGRENINATIGRGVAVYTDATFQTLVTQTIITQPGNNLIEVTGLKPSTIYYARPVFQRSNGGFLYGTNITTTVQTLAWEGVIFHTGPTIGESTATSVVVKGSLNKEKHPDLKNYNCLLEIATDEQLSNILKSIACELNDTGEYSVTITGLTPGEQYSVRSTYTNKELNASARTKIVSFETKKDGGVLLNTPEAIAKREAVQIKESYRLLEKIPGFGEYFYSPGLCQKRQQEALSQGEDIPVCDFGSFLNTLIKLAIGLAAVALVFKLVIEGVRYMTQDLPFVKGKAKQGIIDSLIGLLLALSAFFILNTINPRLVNNTISLERAEFEVQSFATIDSGTFKKITGQDIKGTPEYIALVEKISKEQNIDACIVKATIQHESSWKPNAIGCDEEALADDVPSRKAFIESGIRYDGTTFTERSVFASVKNKACKFESSKPGFGLDWRFSKGGGLMQITIFPNEYKTAAWYEGVKQGGAHWSTRTTPYPGWEKLIIPEDNIRRGIGILKDGLNACNGNTEQVFRRYQTGSCTATGTLVNKVAPAKYATYQKCKQEN